MRFLREFALMSEEERDAAVVALSPEAREGVIALAEAREATARVDLLKVLDAGQGGLEKLYELIQPADLFAVINLAAREQPRLVVDALFAAVVLHRGWDESVPAAFVALRERWHWHVHEQLTAARQRTADNEGSS